MQIPHDRRVPHVRTVAEASIAVRSLGAERACAQAKRRRRILVHDPRRRRLRWPHAIDPVEEGRSPCASGTGDLVGMQLADAMPPARRRLARLEHHGGPADRSSVPCHVDGAHGWDNVGAGGQPSVTTASAMAQRAVVGAAVDEDVPAQQPRPCSTAASAGGDCTARQVDDAGSSYHTAAGQPAGSRSQRGGGDLSGGGGGGGGGGGVGHGVGAHGGLLCDHEVWRVLQPPTPTPTPTAATAATRDDAAEADADAGADAGQDGADADGGRAPAKAASGREAASAAAPAAPLALVRLRGKESVRTIAYEVRPRAAAARRGSSGPLTADMWQVRRYLADKPGSVQSAASVAAFMNAISAFELSKVEKLQLLNLRPASLVDVHMASRGPGWLALAPLSWRALTGGPRRARAGDRSVRHAIHGRAVTMLRIGRDPPAPPPWRPVQRTRSRASLPARRRRAARLTAGPRHRPQQRRPGRPPPPRLARWTRPSPGRGSVQLGCGHVWGSQARARPQTRTGGSIVDERVWPPSRVRDSSVARPMARPAPPRRRRARRQAPAPPSAARPRGASASALGARVRRHKAHAAAR